MTVVRERRLIVGVSARPFDTVAQLARRLRMAFHTIGVEWREWPPLERRADRRRGRRRDTGENPTIAQHGNADADADENTEHPLSA